MAWARSRDDLKRIEPRARHSIVSIFRKYLNELDEADVYELAIQCRVSRLNYSRRCARLRLFRLI